MIPLPIHYAELDAVYVRTMEKGYRTLAVTSAESGEGTSTLAYALARRTAAAGRKTLLVDFNLFRPSVGERLALPRPEWHPNDDSATTAITEFPDLDLSILPAPINAAARFEFREPRAIQDTFKLWQEEFDVIIADTSPLNSVNQSNIPPDRVCASVDATLMVVLSARTPETAVRQAVKRLIDAGASMVGTVMNDRFNPPLAAELVRETRRLDRFLPGPMRWLRRRILNSSLLNSRS